MALLHSEVLEIEIKTPLLPFFCIFFSFIGTKDERSSMWTQIIPEENSSGQSGIQLEGHEGLWIEKQDMWSKYLRRPLDTLGR